MVQDASYIYQELGEKYNWTVCCKTGLLGPLLLYSGMLLE